jgi:hypothetical protein
MDPLIKRLTAAQIEVRLAGMPAHGDTIAEATAEIELLRAANSDVRRIALERDRMRKALQFIAAKIDTSQTCSPGNQAIALRATAALNT